MLSFRCIPPERFWLVSSLIRKVTVMLIMAMAIHIIVAITITLTA
jgi:hypothetical protein